MAVGPPQDWGAGRDRRLRVSIINWVELLSEAGTKRAIVDSATNLEQKIGPRCDQRICCDLFIRRFTRKLAVPSMIAAPTRNPARCRSA
jgi:hypothetical protein